MSLLELWNELLAGTGIPEQRPDFRFDPVFYVERYPDLIDAGVDLKEHFEEHGKVEGRIATAYEAMREHVPDLDQHLAEIVIHRRLRDEIEAGTEDVFKLIFELISLGEPIDRMVSNFSQRHYFRAYPDIEQAGVSAFHHYLQFGVREGRRTLATIHENQFSGEQKFDETKPTCIICVHEFTRTGAPIVGLNLARSAAKTHNVIVMSLRTGQLLEDFQRAAHMVVVSASPDEDFDFFNLPRPSKIDFAVINSAAAFIFARAFIRRTIPYANYLHEFIDYIPVGNAFWSAMFSDLMIFISEKMRQNWTPLLTDMRFNVTRDSIVVPQLSLQQKNLTRKEFGNARQLLSRLIGVDCTKRRIIYGVGFVDWRKGTDLFVLTAQIARKRDPHALFVWIGDGLNHEHIPFGVWLDKHMREAGANDPDGNLFFLPTGTYYHDVCRASDVLFVPSRSDPQPNVVFEALHFGGRAVLFENATSFDDHAYGGIGELQRVEYGDLVGACDALLTAPMKQPTRSDFGTFRQKQAGVDVFQTISAALHKRLSEQRYFVAGAGDYDVPMLFSMRECDREARRNEREKMWSYNRLWVWRSRAQAEAELAASDNWMHQNSRIERFAWNDASPPIDYSIHIHAHYIDDLGGDLIYYRALHEARRIVVTTDSQVKADRISLIARQAGVAVEPLLVPNKGRDILPFMQLFINGKAQEDEIWCHVHQKKSLGVTDAGETWRRFLMAILLGDDTRLSSALEQIVASETGLVTAFDPGVSNWAGSRRLLQHIAPKLPGPIPEHALLFPVGNMFWTRGSVVAQMNGIFGEDYPWPNEPIANDGTVYHLIERLWTAASAMEGLNAVFLDKPDQQRA